MAVGRPAGYRGRVTGPRCDCCYDEAFDDRHAAEKLRAFRRDGPGRATRVLANALAVGGVEGRTILDIGAGLGGLHHLLLAAGAASAVDVDASRPYLDAARAEASRLGLAERVTFRHGDFVAIAAEVPQADLVGLDRVVCCYPDPASLVRSAADHTRRRLGIVLPPDGRIAGLVVGIFNLGQWLRRDPFRIYAHPHAVVRSAATAAGLVPAGIERVGLWRLLLFDRPVLTAAAGPAPLAS